MTAESDANAFPASPSPPTSPTAPSPATSAPASPAAGPVPRPSHIPEKFWDAAKGEVRVDALAKSYGHLERRFSRDRQKPAGVPPLLDVPASSPAPASASNGPAPEAIPLADAAGANALDDADAVDPATVPDAPEHYRIRLGDGPVSRDAELDGLLHAAGFTQAQAQLVYDLAAERVAPLLAELARHYEQAAARGRLEARFGGAQRYAELSRQIHAYGAANLPAEIYETLAGSEDGIVLLHRLMQGGEPRFAAGRGAGAGLDEAALRKLVQDPRYWRDRDPATIARVEAGFRRLYPNGAER